MNELDRIAAPPITLAEFLIDRTAEDEADALLAHPSPWRVDGDGCCVMHSGHDSDHDVAEMTWQNAAHIARWDPARVLAECAAKRSVVESWGRNSRAYREHGRGGEYAAAYEQVMQALALPYADHPDYLPEWRP